MTHEHHTDILIAGGGLGGVAAALAALQLGRKVILTEETDWLGGQLTSQAVPPDEAWWIEESGATASYRTFRELVRHYYREHYPLKPEVAQDPFLNPGLGNVSRLCFEPRVGVAVLEQMLAPYRASRQLEVWMQHVPVAATTDGDTVLAVTFKSLTSGDLRVVTADYVLDATELGDLLELAGVEHVIGAESQLQTGELHALEGEANPLDQQAISWCFAIDHREGEDHTIEKPAQYDFWHQYQAPFWPNRQLSWNDLHPITLKPRFRDLFSDPVVQLHKGDFWHYRRIFYKGHYEDGLYPSDITLVNWPQIDYWLGPIIGVSEEEKQRHLEGAKQLSLSMLYWMQTEAPRHDGKGYGYPGLSLRGDITGTEHGLAKSVYVRESRRIQSEFTVLEQHVGVEARKGLTGAETFHDSVGIGQYRIDLHPSTAGRSYIDVESYPFQIPLGALIPVRVENLLPACKNLGTTHITNGCYRLHPVEWNIGEAAGALAAYCLEKGLKPREVRNSRAHLTDFQSMLTLSLGFELQWPEAFRMLASPGF
ncbi:FAD-dependent oxidoreductase [Deinococcus cellulosilyticus]|uniref:FAD-dependent oxidoreductase n=1 Tax=Deinococcus cellulosilyticus (strain DSM 18568 / NBRC 106333 / KACC 11606 / 5516J-15) TaxID=1223518 RepID=A0A511MY41_DEIC1|nr:FAD-dependent oxidoreductase [Deinococcus cellulosilyticus]GEM45502.1 FAD-dependent oxidoreductase [Deinococcus cellulosilyticus NBRC 106333 = KACC 11606]